MRKWKHPGAGTDGGRNNTAQQPTIVQHSKQPNVVTGGATWRNAAILLTIAITINLTCTGVSSQVCGPPAVPANAKVHTEKANDGSGGLKSARYDCDAGYELFGPDTIRCDPTKGWDRELPFCGTNVAYRKPVNQSSATRSGPAGFANDGKPGNQNPDGQECSETQKEVSPWWRVDLLTPEAVRVVRLTTRGCCGHQPLQDLEIRVGNSSSDLQRNPLCAWYPGTVDEGTTKSFTCARPLIGQYVTVQLVGVESSLSLCEVEVFSNDEFSSDRCAAPNLSVETVLTTFAKTCYEFHITRGESFEKARAVCKSHGGDLIHDFRGVTTDYIISELERRKTDLRTQLVWIGAQKEPGITSRTWKWVNGDTVLKPTWGKDQPNNYNGEQNCVVLDGGRNWLWNDVGCNLDYLNYICQHNPLSCGSPEALVNTTIVGRNYSVGANITYQCPIGHSLIGIEKRTCQQNGIWSGVPPACKYVDCGPLPEIEHGGIILSEQRTSFGVLASYTCHENYTLIGNENRTCQANGWSGTQPKCLIDWCPEPPPIQGGKIKVSGRRAGSTALYTCDYGFVLIGEPVLSCGLGGNWTGKIPVCRYVDCGMPARPDRGNMLLLNDSTTVGSVVRYFCDDDYWLVGPQELYCTKDGKWSGSAPACELITCETPHVPPGSYVIGYDYNIHSSIQYHCDPGHILRGEDTLTCLESGQWSGDAPDCEYVDCGPLTPIPFGSHRYLQNTTFLGSEVVYSCANSHRLAGVNRRICMNTGLWSETAPRCEEIRCTEPTLTPHSFVSVTGNDRMYGRTLIRTSDATVNGAQTFRVGALAKYRCERGYKIVGEALITCEENGLWSGEIPECVYVDCETPLNITNGKVTLATNATYYGAAALYECEGNFKLDGVSRRLCLEDGTWSHETPQCVEITCTEMNVTDALLVNYGNRKVGVQAEFSCSKGRYMVGNGTRTCLSTGHWSGRNPVCKLIDCGRPADIENGRVIVVNESTVYGGSAEYHCVPHYNRIGPYLRKCMDDGKWSGEEPRCELIVNDAQETNSLGTGIAIGAAIIVILLILIGVLFLHRNKARPVKNTENVQAAEHKEDQNAAVMSYSSLENGRHNFDLTNRGGLVTFNTFHQSGAGHHPPPPSQLTHSNHNNNHLSSSNNNTSSRSGSENIYDQIPSEQFYDAPYEMRTNEEVYEPEPTSRGNIITINGVSVR
ncbi:sushi, von Willebrand factor type A, EGF and pentraxin domain-containing protein 1 [Anopheles funestus]|uniref:sushi, von Willebrand factor type A, EGF and pentraxin domain-containing protein 1 n=1 Tax=Anopheles funestus TaxID=62324 RepID=UPI0020C5D91E|nr:sushi, von Willebrand factor type A, EGF and pentraxin domain-containing protein 1 [Anopheles funestus]XP_049300035.1 sushi, von Willebrand factor type A, EGF and pentraxin domain-containing protein 1 [Anopheles funestus]XP_049300045.1 sushi, von Willebrand factor type A, EGF and pentraxin domain-containing protein 1 [Anopheles funestus]